MMDLDQMTKHPEIMDKETLYDLRSLLALYPYYQTARILMLKNLYLLHDPSFDEELRKAAVYITDRKVIFNLVEAAHYRITPQQPVDNTKNDEEQGSRTVALIDQFLGTLPTEKQTHRRKPTPADAAVDYVAYLLESEYEENNPEENETPQMKGQDLIDNFINIDGGKFELKDEPEIVPQIEEEKNNDISTEDGYVTETLARIYIKQGNYFKALEIIKRLNLNNPKKNAYFADQIRFLEKLIINSKYKQ